MLAPGKPPLYVRKLSPIERYNIVINSVIRYDVEAVIEGEGHLDLEQWKRAVAISAEANPGARVRLQSFLGFSKWVDSGIAPEVSVVNSSTWDGYSEVGTETLQTPFDPVRGGPVCDIKLIPGSPARIIVRASHGAMDARGITHFTIDTMRVLSGKAPLGSRDTVTDIDIRMMHQDKVTATPKEPIIASPVISPSENHRHPLRYVWRRVTINNNIARSLPKVAEFLAGEARKNSPDANVVFTVPVDYRGLRHETLSTANLTGYLRIEVDKDDSIKTIMKKVNSEVKAYADCLNPGYLKLLSWMPFNLMNALLAKKADKVLYENTTELPTGGVVSLGHFKLEEWSYPEFSAKKIIGIPGSVGKLNVLIHNYSDCTEVVFSTPAAYNADGQLDTLIERFQSAFNR